MNNLSDNHLLLIGKILGVHGIKGTLKVSSYAESLSVFKAGSFITLRDGNGIDANYTVRWVKPYRQGALLQLDGIDDCDTARLLTGSMLYVERHELPELEDGEYYWADIVGLSVFTTDDVYIGRVESIFSTGSNDVMVVKDNVKEILVPALGSVIKRVDLGNNSMVVDLPEGL